MPFCFIVWSWSVVDKRLIASRKAIERMWFCATYCISVDAGTIGSSDPQDYNAVESFPLPGGVACLYMFGVALVKPNLF